MAKELELASSQELLDELASRYQNMVFAANRPTKVQAEEKKEYKLRWHGDGMSAAGLCITLIDDINQDRRETEEKVDPEEV